MKKGAIYLIIAISLILGYINYIYAESCSPSLPIIGNVQCHTFPQDIISYTSYSNCETSGDYFCQFNFNCNEKINCHIDSSDIYIKCPSGNWRPYLIRIYKDGSQIPEEYDLKNGYQDIPNFQSLTIKVNCIGTIIGWNKNNILSSSSIANTYQNKYLFDSNPNNPGNKVDSTIGCNPIGIQSIPGYSSQIPYSWTDIYGNLKGSKPTNLVDNLPQNINDGIGYSYLYGWNQLTGLLTVNGKDGNIAAYCGGETGKRNILSTSKVSNGASCYIIPTSFQRNVDCCNNDDCKLKDPSGKSVCDPSTFSCTIERPCNTDSDCSIISQDTCNNKVLNSWKCDQNLPWKPYTGTCKLKSFNVSCCIDKECGTNSPFGGLFCNQNNVFQNYLSYKCLNPGSMNSTCTNSSTPTLINNCGKSLCNNYEENYCKNGDVYHNQKCYDKGCSNSTCFSSQYINESLVEKCLESKTCENGKCIDIPIICYLDSQCNDHNESTDDKCINPNTTKSYCENDPQDLGFPIINSPNEGDIFNSRRILISVSVKKQVKSIKYQLDGKKSRNGQDVYIDLCNNKYCLMVQKILTFLDGNHTLGIITINDDNRQQEDSVNFFIDSKDPRITKTTPSRNKLTNGNFSVEFIEQNPKTLTLYYGPKDNKKSINIDTSTCSFKKDKYSCSTKVDINQYKDQSIEYSFKIVDIAGNSDENRAIVVKV